MKTILFATILTIMFAISVRQHHRLSELEAHFIEHAQNHYKPGDRLKIRITKEEWNGLSNH